MNKKNLETPKRSGNYHDIIAIGIILLLGVIIYSNSYNCSFHFDDAQSIVNNPDIRSLDNVKPILNSGRTRFIPYYTFAINYHFGQLNVRGYHIVNLLIHLINAALVWLITLLLFSTPSLKNNPLVKHKRSIAIITALLFVSHPLATQSVTYIVQRMNSLAALFYLLSLILYIKARITDKSTLPKVGLYIGSFVSAVLAMLSKENSFTLPFAIVLMEVFFLQTKKISIDFKNIKVIALIAVLVCFVVILFITYSSNILQPELPSENNDYRTITSGNYLLTQFSVITKYIQLLFLPINQTIDYDFPLANSFFEIRTLLSFLFIISLLGLAIYLFNKNRLISFGIFWFFLTLSIESSIIPISDLIFEHRTYLPSVGFFLILSTVIYSFLWQKYKYVAIGVLGILILVNSVNTYARNKVWKDDLTLWGDAILKSPNKARPYNNRGHHYAIDLQNYEMAIKDFNMAIQVNPKFYSAYSNIGFAYNNMNRHEDAIEKLNIAISLKSDSPDAFYNRAIAYADLKKYDEAIKDYDRVIKISPNYYKAYNNKGSVYYDLLQYDKALECYNKSVELSPDYSFGYFNIGSTYGMLNNTDLELINYDKAIELNPDYRDAYSKRGQLLYKQKKYEQAIDNFNHVLELQFDNADGYFNRGAAEFYANQKTKACEDWQKALNYGYKPAADLINKYCH
jgi:tetratricopeptide (TPR) repeat protein